jgi:hypothetical protein
MIYQTLLEKHDQEISRKCFQTGHHLTGSTSTFWFSDQRRMIEDIAHPG